MAAVVRAALTDGLVDNVGGSYLILCIYAAISVMVSAWVIGRRH